MKNPIAACGGSQIYLGEVARLLPELLPEGRVVVISDQTVWQHYSGVFNGLESILLPEGEHNKTLATVERLYRRFVEMGLDRHTFILAVGGGIVSDMGGFAAATYMRGMRFGTVPTTLLAQVDASTGGKNGVNLDGYKNMVGTFAHPEFVLLDTAFLATLPQREFRSGLAEVVKAAIIGDRGLFELLERSDAEAVRHDRALLERVVAAALRVKVDIVARDEREADVRRVLNLGHTFGHAIEHSTSLFTHGEAVATGMVMAATIAERCGVADSATRDRIVNLLLRYGFSTVSPVAHSELLAAITHDKKGNRGVTALVLPADIGHCIIRPTTPEEIHLFVVDSYQTENR